MDITTKITIVVGLVIGGSLMILISGAGDQCSQSHHMEQCKQFIQSVTYAGWGSAILGLILGFLIVKFSKGDVKPFPNEVEYD